MVTKPVHLRNGTGYAKAGDADAAFKAILGAGAAGDPVVGKDKDLVHALYLDYCAATNWPLKSEPVGYVRDWQKDKGYTTKCFYAEFADGSRVDFSYGEAVKAVANWKR